MSENLNSEKIFGIDLGTTYSAISWIDPDGKAVIIPNAEGDSTTPSVVFFESASNVIVGKVAKSSGAADSTNVVSFIKRYMGTTKEDREADREALEDLNSLNFWDKEYSPEMVSALILDKLRKDASEATQTPVRKAVITCPAYFGEKERQATEDAGRIAGLEVIQVLDEPAAAALCYVLDSSVLSDKNVLVYDLGGGTFDVTVLRMTTDGRIEVVCSDGDHRLGGKDWDVKVKNYLAEQFNIQTNTSDDILKDNETDFDLRLKAEELKQQLTGREKSSITVAHGGERAKIELTREKFDELTLPELERTFGFTDNVLAIAESKGISSYDEILLVGGSTKMPQVKEGVKQRYGTRYGVEPRSFEPDTAVSKGATLFAHAKYITRLRNIEIERLKQEAGGGANLSHEQEEQIKKKATETLSAAMGISAEKIEFADIVGKGLKLAATKSYGVAVQTNEGLKVFKMIENHQPLPYENARVGFVPHTGMSQLSFDVYSFNTTEESLDPDICLSIGNGLMDLSPGIQQGTPVKAFISLTEQGKLFFEGEIMQEAQGHEPNVEFIEGFGGGGTRALLPTGHKLKFELQTDTKMTEEEIAEERAAIGALSVS